jgi:YbbR domain-containing protein
VTSVASKGVVRRALTENVSIKLVALVASIGLFVIVRGTEDAQISIAVDVVALLPPSGEQRMLTSEIPDQVRVTLRGSRAVLNALRRDGMAPIQMDLRDASSHFYYFEQEEFELPAGATIVQIAPAAVPLTWVDTAERRLRVEPTVSGQVADGLFLTSSSVEPPSLVVRGAASEVNRLEIVRTQSVDVSRLEGGSHSFRVPLMPLPDDVTYVDVVSAVVTVVIDEEEGSRTFRDLDVAVVGGGDVQLRPSAVDVRLNGPRARVEDLHPRRIVPFVDVSGLEPGRGGQSRPVQLRALPDGMTAIAEPAEVLVLPAP